MKMKTVLAGLLTGLMALGLWGSRVEASSITDALDCIISGGEGCTSFGTVAFLDGVDANVDGFTAFGTVPAEFWVNPPAWEPRLPLMWANLNLLLSEIGGSGTLCAWRCSRLTASDPSDPSGAAVQIDVPNGGGGEDSISMGAQSVVNPEPSTLVLLGSGLAGLGAWGRKRLRRGRAG